MAYNKMEIKNYTNKYNSVGKKPIEVVNINGIDYLQIVKPGYQKVRGQKSPGDRDTVRMSIALKDLPDFVVIIKQVLDDAGNHNLRTAEPKPRFNKAVDDDLEF